MAPNTDPITGDKIDDRTSPELEDGETCKACDSQDCNGLCDICAMEFATAADDFHFCNGCWEDDPLED
jgi:hypothetical protein